MFKIALDAGHGEYTQGKRVPPYMGKGDISEWSLNNKVANIVEERLKGYKDIHVIRLDDPLGKEDVPLNHRTNKANKENCDILISIHHNLGILGKNGGGISIYRFPNSNKFTKDMQIDLYNELIEFTGLKGNRAKPLEEKNFHMLIESNMAAVLIENGFMDSRTDLPIILSEGHQKQSAVAIVSWLVQNYKLKKKEESKENIFYRVVAGSYQDKANALKQMEKLEKLGVKGVFLTTFRKDD